MALPIMQIIQKAKGRNEAGTSLLQEGASNKDKGQVFAGINEFANPLPEQFRQPISGMLQEKFGKSDELPFIQREDPRQTEALLELERRAKNIEAGTDVSTQQAIEQARKTTGATQSRLARATGGSSGATVDALLKAQRAGQESSNQAIAQGQQRLPFFLNLGQQLRNRVAQRRLELDLLDRAQFSAEKAQGIKEDNINRQRQEGADIAMGKQDERSPQEIMGIVNKMKGLFGDQGGAPTVSDAPATAPSKGPIDPTDLTGGGTEVPIDTSSILGGLGSDFGGSFTSF